MCHGVVVLVKQLLLLLANNNTDEDCKLLGSAVVVSLVELKVLADLVIFLEAPANKEEEDELLLLYHN